MEAVWLPLESSQHQPALSIAVLREQWRAEKNTVPALRGLTFFKHSTHRGSWMAEMPGRDTWVESCWVSEGGTLQKKTTACLKALGTAGTTRGQRGRARVRGRWWEMRVGGLDHLREF